MAQARVQVVESFAVAPEALFERLLDHEGMSRWIGARVSVLAGPVDGGVGTIRRIAARGLTIDEEIVYVDAPRRIAYRVMRGVPLLRFHRGEILVEPWGQTGSSLTWDILLDSAVPGVARLVAAILKPAIRKGLGKLRTQLAERAHSASSGAAASPASS